MFKKKLSAFLALALASAMLVGCGASGNDSAQAEGAAETDDSKPSFVFVCTGQLGDKSFNDSANAGIEEIAASLGCETRVIEVGRDQTKWEPTFQDLAEEGEYDVIISNGSSSIETIQKVAEEFPEQKFVAFDCTIENEDDRKRNFILTQPFHKFQVYFLRLVATVQ